MSGRDSDGRGRAAFERGATAVTPLGRLAVEFFAYLGGMTAYAVHLLASPPVVPLSCEIGSTWPLHALSAVVLVTIAAATAVAWWLWRGSDVPRTRFLGLSGFMLNVLAFAVVVFAEVPNHFLDPCLP